jgi:hypothetical protein
MIALTFAPNNEKYSATLGIRLIFAALAIGFLSSIVGLIQNNPEP